MTKKEKKNKKVGSNCGHNTKPIPEGNVSEISEKQVMFIDSNKAEKAIACSDSDADDDSEADEEWEMKKIMSIEAVKEPCPIKCSHDTCTLVAATIWISNFKPTENWYSCLDCQENDFDGWPDLDELPLTHMTHEHQKALIEHCSKYKDCAMPIFDLSPTKDGTISTIINHPANTITPPPIVGTLEQQQEQFLGRPSTDVALSSDTMMIPNKKPSAELKPSKAQLEIHRKWQAAAEAEGGPNARIVLYKPSAKKMIFEFLFDAFRPMNITEIYKGLKAIVPSPILKACLDDMALDNDYSTQFVDSDNDDDNKSTKDKKITNSASDYTQFKNSLSYKGGKGSNSGLYYVNYNEAKGGDGLDGEEKNQLSSDIAIANSKKSAIENELNHKRAVAAKLRSEPINDDLNTLLAKAESESCELSAKLESTRKFKANEKVKENTKKRIDYFSSVWRKRRKLCMDFLICMEELTEGLVTLKTCLGGNGQIDIESDENIMSIAREFSKKTRHPNRTLQAAEPKMNYGTKDSILQPSKNFVAVSLDSQGKVLRVYIDDGTK